MTSLQIALAIVLAALAGVVVCDLALSLGCDCIAVAREAMLALSHASGHVHPGLIEPDRSELLDGHFGARTPMSLFGYQPDWGRPSAEDRAAIRAIMQRPVQAS